MTAVKVETTPLYHERLDQIRIAQDPFIVPGVQAAGSHIGGVRIIRSASQSSQSPTRGTDRPHR